jgi:hypothetical protein
VGKMLSWARCPSGPCDCPQRPFRRGGCETDGHEAIEELLAGYVLRALSDEDAALADGLLLDYLPSCTGCRDTLATFQRIAADLALAVPAVAPPESLLLKLTQELGPDAEQ